MILFRTEFQDTPDIVVERIGEALAELGLEVQLVDEDPNGDWSEYGIRRSRDDA